MTNQGSAVRANPVRNQESDETDAVSPEIVEKSNNTDSPSLSFVSRRNTENALSSEPEVLRKGGNPPNKPVAVPAEPEIPRPANDAQKAQPIASPDGRPMNPNPGPTKPKKKKSVEAAALPTAKPAKMKTRHWGIAASFLFCVIVPLLAVVSYLFIVAEKQYHSLSGFTVRSQEESSANDFLGGLSALTGGSVASDSDILYEFIQSQEMVTAISQRIDLREHYSQFWPNDWVFSIWPDASQEELIWFWNRVVGVSYDQSTGLIEVQVKAFDPALAREINEAIVAESHVRINELNLAAREEAMRYAMTDLEQAVARLKNAREALTVYRTQSQIVDPATDIQTRMGVMNSLQQQLASALVEYDLLRGSTSDADPRLRDTSQRIEVIRDRIAIERQNFASSSTETGGVEQDYPTLISEFERLTVDREYAEQYYFASLTALEIARDQANRQSRYLATYINPTLAETSEFPKKFVLSGLAALFLLLGWSICTLIYYSIRDKS